jgi:prevent-host-death family protein
MIFDVGKAKSQISKLVEMAERGEEVILARTGKPVARLVKYRSSNGPRVGGQWKGRVRIAPDFDEIPPEIAEVFPPVKP